MAVRSSGGTPVNQALSATMRTLRDFRSPDFDNGEHPWVNPIFILPGSITKPDFEGMKLGHYSKKKKGAVVMIAVPQAVVDGPGTGEFIIKSLRGACDIAATFFAEKGETFDLPGAQSLIGKVEQKLQQSA